MKAALFIACAAFAAAQPAFDTASVRPATACAESMIQPLPGAGLRATCISAFRLIAWAYGLQDYQLTGGPSWLGSANWDIMAKSDAQDPAKVAPLEDLSGAERTARINDVQLRLRALLAARFQLTLRKEMKEQTTYALVIARNGPAMKASERAGMIRRGRSQILATGATLSQLCFYLGIALARPVADKTGLAGYYAFDLNWAPEGPDSADSSYPALVTAVQEQLGLRLEAVKAPTETFVIERLEKASEN